jgi:hypothetical protein
MSDQQEFAVFVLPLNKSVGSEVQQQSRQSMTHSNYYSTDA